MEVNGDTSVGRSADPLPYRGATGTGGKILVAEWNSRRRRGISLRHEDQIEPGIGRHGMRTGRLGNGFDEHARAIDHAEYGAPAERRTSRLRVAAGSRVIASVARVEPDLVGTGDVAYLRIMMGHGVDDQSGRATRQVPRRTTEQEVVVHSDGGAIRAAGIERDYAHIFDRIVCSLHYRAGIELVRISDQKAAAAGNRAGELAIIAAWRIVGNDRDRCVEAFRLWIPGGLLKAQAEARRQDQRVHRNFGEYVDVAGPFVAIRSKKSRKWGIVSVVRGQQLLAVRGKGHFVEPEEATGGYHLLGAARWGGIEIDYMQRAIAVSGVKPATVGRNAGGTGPGVVYRRARAVEYDALKGLVQAGGAHEFEVLDVDDVDALGRAVSQIIFGSRGIDEADVERFHLNAGDSDRGQAPGLRV